MVASSNGKIVIGLISHFAKSKCSFAFSEFSSTVMITSFAIDFPVFFKMRLNELSEEVAVTNVNLSKMKTGKISAIRFSTLEAICDVLDCQPGDILEYDKNAVSEEREEN